VTDINVFVRRSRRSAEREAVGHALMRQQVNAGKLKLTWMSEEEKAAYRLREPPDAGADRGGVYDSEPRPATRRAPRGDQAAGTAGLRSEGLISGRAAGPQDRRALVVSSPGAHFVAACLRLARGCRRAVWSR
jgi:hypothetical protein